MLVNLLLRLSTLSLGLSYVASTTPQQQSQLATLHERMNQMINALYSSPLLSKVKAATSSEESTDTSSPETTLNYSTVPAPQVVFVSPPSFLEAGAQPTDYGYSLPTNPVPRAAWPYPYEYSYQTQFAPPVYSPPLPRSPYPEYPRPAYPQIPTPQPASLSPSYPSPPPYASAFSPAQYPAPFPHPSCQPSYTVAPSMSIPYPPQASYPPIHPSIHPSNLSPAPRPYPPMYPPSLSYQSAPYPTQVPQHYGLSVPYPSSVPTPYPSINPVPYSPSFTYPQSLPYSFAPPHFPKPSDILPQPQYEYSG